MEASLLTNIMTLGMLILLQLVLGFDNLLYISLESQNAPADRQSYVRKMGIGMAIVLRIALLFILISVIDYFQDPIWEPKGEYFEGSINIHSLIVLLGGAFIIYTAMKEIWHMVSLDEHEVAVEKKTKSVGQVIFMIIVMNLVFSFDSILSAMALTDVFWVMATAIMVGGVLMVYLADTISAFLKKNKMYEVLGLFILFLVGIMLCSEGGHLAHLKFFGNEITPMSKTTFYFVLVILVITDVVQGRYQKKLTMEQAAAAEAKAEQS